MVSNFLAWREVSAKLVENAHPDLQFLVDGQEHVGSEGCKGYVLGFCWDLRCVSSCRLEFRFLKVAVPQQSLFLHPVEGSLNTLLLHIAKQYQPMMQKSWKSVIARSNVFFFGLLAPHTWKPKKQEVSAADKVDRCNVLSVASVGLDVFCTCLQCECKHAANLPTITCARQSDHTL